MIARPSRPCLREALAIASNDHHPALLWTEMFRRGLIENLCDDRRKFQSHDGRWTYHPPTREACVVFAADWPNVLRAEHVARNYAFDDEHTKRIVWVEGDPFADEADRPPDEARHEWVRQLDALGYRLHKHSPDIVMIYPSPTEERKPLPRGNLAWPMSNVTSGARMSFAIEVDRETDGRWIAEVTDAPVSVIVYGPSCAEAIAKALRVLATELENPDDEDVTPVTRRTCCGLGNEDVPLSVARNMRAKQYRPMTRDRAEHLSHVVTELYRQLGGTRATAQRDVFYMLLPAGGTGTPADSSRMTFGAAIPRGHPGLAVRPSSDLEALMGSMLNALQVYGEAQKQIELERIRSDNATALERTRIDAEADKEIATLDTQQASRRETTIRIVAPVAILSIVVLLIYSVHQNVLPSAVTGIVALGAVVKFLLPQVRRVSRRRRPAEGDRQIPASADAAHDDAEGG